VEVGLTGAPSGLPAPLLPDTPLLLLPDTPLLLLLDPPELDELPPPPPLSLVLDPPQAAARATPTETTKKIRAPFIRDLPRTSEFGGR
jgi:hypothetical protein